MCGGCDQGAPHDQASADDPTSETPPPYVHLTAANIGPDRGIPADGPIRLAFDRLLLPVTVVRQSFQLKDASGVSLQSPIVTYDPVTRVVTLANPSADPRVWLTEGQAYRLDIGVPAPGDEESGPRAIDGAALDPTRRSFSIAFRALAPGVPDGGGYPRALGPDVSFCDGVLPTLQRSCAPCHGASTRDADAPPVLGLRLDSPDGIRRTALDVLAVETSTGARLTASPPGGRFGTNMARLRTFAPGESYLLYKALLGAAPNPGPLTYDRLDTPLSVDERARLSAQITGAAMPYPGSGIAPLTARELEVLSTWIATGAAMPDTCP